MTRVSELSMQICELSMLQFFFAYWFSEIRCPTHNNTCHVEASMYTIAFFASTGNMMSQLETNGTFMYMQMVHSRNKALLEIWQRPQNYGTKCEIPCMSQIQDTHSISCNKNVRYLFGCLKLE